jgi:MHS family proline/betaine transporter-like MFS transporter
MLSMHVDDDKDWKASDCTVTEPSTIRRAISAASIGNVAEWYDFGVYAFFEPTIQKVFFSISPTRWVRSRRSGCSRSRS